MGAAGWSVRRAELVDMGSILAIERGSVEAPQWGEAVWRGVLRDGEGSGSARRCFLVEGDGGIVGFAVVSCSFEVAELESVAVAEGARRQGVGRAVCRAAMEWARECEAERMELEVRASSEGAQALYVELGFQVMGRRRGYYREPVEDAVLMTAMLRGNALR